MINSELYPDAYAGDKFTIELVGPVIAVSRTFARGGKGGSHSVYVMDSGDHPFRICRIDWARGLKGNVRRDRGPEGPQDLAGAWRSDLINDWRTSIVVVRDMASFCSLADLIRRIDKKCE